MDGWSTALYYSKHSACLLASNLSTDVGMRIASLWVGMGGAAAEDEERERGGERKPEKKGETGFSRLGEAQSKKNTFNNATYLHKHSVSLWVSHVQYCITMRW